MQLPDTVLDVLAAYPSDCQPRACEDRGGAGGFSGARLWRLSTPRGMLCLRRWPVEHPSRERLVWIQSIVGLAAASGFRLLPLPVSTRQGDGFVAYDGHLWEVTPWMPGRADFDANPSPERLGAAMVALAQYHRATESAPGPPGGRRKGDGESPGLRERLAMANQLTHGGLEALQRAVETNRRVWPELADRVAVMLDAVARRLRGLCSELIEVSNLRVPLQPCLRDIWHDHVLFEADQVTGIIDVGSMRMETVTGDIARLLGSLSPHLQSMASADRCHNAWKTGIEAYESIRRLSDVERRLIPVFDQAQRLLSGINWAKWVFVEQRSFSDPAAVVRRMDNILRALE